MKRIVLFASVLCLLAASCSKKDDTKTTTPTTTTNTNKVNGKWKITLFDNGPVNAPDSGSYQGTASSATEGTYHFELHYGGSRIEDGNYTLSNNNATINFTDTNSNGILIGGNPWTINTLTDNTFRFTSTHGLVIECTK